MRTSTGPGPLSLVFLLVSAIACAPEPPAQERDAPTPHVIDTNQAPAAIGPYSQAVQVGNTLYLAGQLGLDPESGELVAGGIEPETRQTLENLGAVLAAADFAFDDVVQSQVFLADLDEFSSMNEIYATYFGDRPPARATVEVARLPRDARIEIMFTAVRSP